MHLKLYNAWPILDSEYMVAISTLPISNHLCTDQSCLNLLYPGFSTGAGSQPGMMVDIHHVNIHHLILTRLAMNAVLSLPAWHFTHYLGSVIANCQCSCWSA